MGTETPDGLSSAAAGVCAFLAELGIRKTSAVHVVGTGALPALLWLCRHGYERVLMLAVARTPTESADLLLALDASGPGALEQLAADLPRVRPGGVVIVGARRGAGEATRQLLCGHGLRLERRLRLGRRDIWVARRGAPALVAAAETPAAA